MKRILVISVILAAMLLSACTALTPTSAPPPAAPPATVDTTQADRITEIEKQLQAKEKAIAKLEQQIQEQQRKLDELEATPTTPTLTVTVTPTPTPTLTPTPSPTPATPTPTPTPSAAPLEIKPAFFVLGELTIRPQLVKSGDTVNISIPVSNTGGRGGQCILTLKINGIWKDWEVVTLKAGETKTVGFTTSGNVAGTYFVHINGERTVFTKTQNGVVTESVYFDSKSNVFTVSPSRSGSSMGG